MLRRENGQNGRGGATWRKKLLKALWAWYNTGKGFL
jgi:hypothetical protein